MIARKKKFTQRVLQYVEGGATYLDAISSLAKEMNIEERTIPSLLEDVVKDNLEAEARTLRLLKEE